MDLGEKRHCLQCERPLTGRTDKKFCDAYCRNSYNNRSKRADEELIHTLNSQLRRNRRILKTLCPVGKATVRREVLDALGFNYKVFSGIYRSPKGLVYYISYDYAFSPLRDDNHVEKALIVQTQDYFASQAYNPWSYLKS